jgi:hypothetical protein
MGDMSRAAQRPLNRNVVLVRADHQHDVAGNLAAGDHAREHGGRVVALMMPLRVESRMNFRSGVILDSLDGWSGPMALPLAEKMALLGNADERRRLEALAAPTAATHAWANWWSLEILETYLPETSRYEGRVVGDVAAAAGQAPFDTLVEIALTDRLLTTFGVRQPPDTLATGRSARRRSAILGRWSARPTRARTSTCSPCSTRRPASSRRACGRTR